LKTCILWLRQGLLFVVRGQLGVGQRLLIFFTTDFSRSYTEILNRLRRETKNNFLMISFSVSFRGKFQFFLTTDFRRLAAGTSPARCKQFPACEVFFLAAGEAIYSFYPC